MQSYSVFQQYLAGIRDAALRSSVADPEANRVSTAMYTKVEHDTRRRKDPTEAQIHIHCQQIQLGWSAQERRKRAGVLLAPKVNIQVVAEEEYLDSVQIKA